MSHASRVRRGIQQPTEPRLRLLRVRPRWRHCARVHNYDSRLSFAKLCPLFFRTRSPSAHPGAGVEIPQSRHQNWCILVYFGEDLLRVFQCDLAPCKVRLYGDMPRLRGETAHPRPFKRYGCTDARPKIMKFQPSWYDVVVVRRAGHWSVTYPGLARTLHSQITYATLSICV